MMTLQRNLSCAVAVSLSVGLLGVPNLRAGNPTLPVIEGNFKIDGLSSTVTIARDRLSIPEIRGQSLMDVIRAQGFVHAQDRFFQMDAARRLAAGELSEIVGAVMLDMDKRYRRYQFRPLARQVVESLDPGERALLVAYTEGVNAGLESLAVLPPEYGMLNVEAKPWREEDSILIIYAMFDMLHLEAGFEKRLGVMRDALPEELFEFLTPRGTRFDVPLLNDGNPGNDWQPMDIPGPEVIDLRAHSSAEYQHLPGELVQVIDIAVGSNNWAVAGSRSVHGGAIVANDPHLQLTAPGIWYRAQFTWNNETNPRTPRPTSHAPSHSAGGLTLPGVPGVVIGSTAHIAWGFTNTMGDFQDLIVIDVHPDDPNLYRTSDGYEPFVEEVLTINVRGRGHERLTLRKTRWGTVTDTDHRGRPLVLKWTALVPPEPGTNLGIFDMMNVCSLDEAVNAARQWFGPSQNMLIAHRDGGIAWIVTGYLPDRFGPPPPHEYDGRFPTSWANGDRGWHGPVPEDERPVIINPDSGILYTANNRTVDLKRARRLGGVWVTGERAARIKELLNSKDRFDEDDLFAMQFDTRVRIFDYYRDLAIEAMIPESNGGIESDLFEDALEIVQSWNGTADADQPAMRLLNTFRGMLHWMMMRPLVAACSELDPQFMYWWFMQEEPVRRILEERPAHLLPPGYGSWDDLIARTWKYTLDSLGNPQFDNGIRTTWGEANRAAISHPIVQALPQHLTSMLGKSLRMPETPQPGHPFAVRVAMPGFGASARMVVSPGREARGILHTPAGQSGHFQSPHFSDGHSYWDEGRALPFLPGDAVATMTLEPQRE